jgi:leader peptidase (prepilin peptidase)/N-methyltransferase
VSIVIGLFGALIGSFLNVVVYRVPAGLSIVSPPSACPNCGNHIRRRHNVPVLGWLVLRGRCHDCASPISVRYPLVELGTALLFALVALRFVPALIAAPDRGDAVAAVLQLVAFLYLAAVSVALALIDLDTMRLPNAIVLPSYSVGVALFAVAAALTGQWEPLLRALAGLAILGVVYLAIVLVAPRGMGMGDVKLAGVLGLFLGWLGWDALAVGGLSAFLLGGLFGVVLLAVSRAGRSTAIPFGPWMLLGAWIGIFAGAPIASAYLSLFGLEY